MLIIRLILISLIIYLIIRSFVSSLETKKSETSKPEPDDSNSFNRKKVSKEIGEYIDYEEVDKRKHQD